MENSTICGSYYEYQEKRGRSFVTTFYNVNESQVFAELAHELVAKKLNNCTYIRSIKRVPLCNGYDRITISYDHGGRRVYTVAS